MRTQFFRSFLLLSVIAVPVSAQSLSGARDPMRISQLQNADLEAGERHSAQSAQAQIERPRSREFELPDASAYLQPDTDAVVSDNSRRPGRLSPEERRALRRQIDEAGHDIYSPKR